MKSYVGMLLTSGGGGALIAQVALGTDIPMALWIFLCAVWGLLVGFYWPLSSKRAD